MLMDGEKNELGRLSFSMAGAPNAADAGDYDSDYVWGLSVGHISCTAMVVTMVRKRPASWGCAGQTIFVRSRPQARKPAAVPIKVAINVIFQVVMNSLSGRYKTEVLSPVRRISNLSLLAWRVENQIPFSLGRIPRIDLSS